MNKDKKVKQSRFRQWKSGKKWLYMHVDYIGFGSNERIRSIGDYYVQYNKLGRIIYLVKF